MSVEQRPSAAPLCPQIALEPCGENGPARSCLYAAAECKNKKKFLFCGGNCPGYWGHNHSSAAESDVSIISLRAGHSIASVARGGITCTGRCPKTDFSPSKRERAFDKDADGLRVEAAIAACLKPASDGSLPDLDPDLNQNMYDDSDVKSGKSPPKPGPG